MLQCGEKAYLIHNSIYVEILSRLKLGITCYHLEQNLFSSSSLYKCMMIKIQKTITLPVLLWYNYSTHKKKIAGPGKADFNHVSNSAQWWNMP